MSSRCCVWRSPPSPVIQPCGSRFSSRLVSSLNTATSSSGSPYIPICWAQPTRRDGAQTPPGLPTMRSTNPSSSSWRAVLPPRHRISPQRWRPPVPQSRCSGQLRPMPTPPIDSARPIASWRIQFPPAFFASMAMCCLSRLRWTAQRATRPAGSAAGNQEIRLCSRRFTAFPVIPERSSCTARRRRNTRFNGSTRRPEVASRQASRSRATRA